MSVVTIRLSANTPDAVTAAVAVIDGALGEGTMRTVANHGEHGQWCAYGIIHVQTAMDDTRREEMRRCIERFLGLECNEPLG